MSIELDEYREMYCGTLPSDSNASHPTEWHLTIVRSLLESFVGAREAVNTYDRRRWYLLPTWMPGLRNSTPGHLLKSPFKNGKRESVAKNRLTASDDQPYEALLIHLRMWWHKRDQPNLKCNFNYIQSTKNGYRYCLRHINPSSIQSYRNQTIMNQKRKILQVKARGNLSECMLQENGKPAKTEVPPNQP
ncbi:uncharacterized protein BDR25DRAFT_351238 [Lindgomyces ingoldianus]|uniref:Uncharacterized protein n=1 Tax=Lindgomyces ingoldianus TaxID=673940 RepID=A0ACB6R7C8_9PLEO|nr:uncharacterized protein BDR25DRAFT_351238 [Lindgomyces ingoldianus]KAF2474713.1 hypothetical protein BDR25DRAFT_351238 [Lindgomyces ingoldianus]